VIDRLYTIRFIHGGSKKYPYFKTNLFSVSVTKLGCELYDEGIGVCFSAEAKDFSLLHSIQAEPVASGVLLTNIRRPGLEANLLSPASIRVKNARSYTGGLSKRTQLRGVSW
jgi:hypothetical protein